MASYAEKTDLRLGNIPLPADSVTTRALQQAADEINSALGMRYVTPIVATGPTAQAVTPLIKNINVWLATGRLIEELTASTEDAQVHAYARSMITEAQAVIKLIVTGELVLDGVPPISTGATSGTGPMLVNQDAASNVDVFYGTLSNPVKGVQDNPLHNYPYGYVYGGIVYRG